MKFPFKKGKEVIFEKVRSRQGFTLENQEGRLTDFEDVVRLDRQYILDWSMGLDVRILIKTVGLVLHGEGAW